MDETISKVPVVGSRATIMYQDYWGNDWELPVYVEEVVWNREPILNGGYLNSVQLDCSSLGAPKRVHDRQLAESGNEVAT